jgi:hypothetical protein
MKIMFEFNINKEQEVDEVEISKNEKNEEIKITKKVKKNVPVKLAIKKPNRNLFDEAELFYGVKLSEGIKAGLLTRALLAKRFSNDGGIFSELDKEEYTKLYVSLFDLQTKFQKLSLKEEPSRNEEEKEEYKSLLKEISKNKEKLQDYEFAQASLFDQTAENRARNKTIMWWVLQLSLIENFDKKYENLFNGLSFEEKLSAYDSIEDGPENSWEKQALAKFIYLISFWYTGRASTQEEFEKLLNMISTETKEVPSVEDSSIKKAE